MGHEPEGQIITFEDEKTNRIIKALALEMDWDEGEMIGTLMEIGLIALVSVANRDAELLIARVHVMMPEIREIADIVTTIWEEPEE